MKFWLTQHARERYIERVLKGETVDNLNVTMLKHLGAGSDITSRIYDDCPRYILFLYEKYKGLGITIIRSGDVIFITRKRKGTYHLYDVLTCMVDDGNYLKQFKNTALTREEIFLKIKIIKAKLK